MRRAAFITIVIFIAVVANGQIVATRSAVPQLLIPAAGAVQGGGNTFFRSDITIINYRPSNQRVRLQWLPQSPPGAASSVDITIDATSGIATEDFVTNTMQQSGLGAILVTGIDSTGAFDPSALLVATSRIWTPAQGGSGTESQSLPSVATPDINSGVVTILGARRDARYRTNVGIVNLSTAAQTYQVSVGGSFAAETQQVTVAALSMSLFAVATDVSSATPLQIQVVNVGAPPRSTFWVAYASSVDNVTGDAWSSLGFNTGPPPP